MFLCRYGILFTQKYIPPLLLFFNFAGWIDHKVPFCSLFLADPVDCEYIETEPADSALLTVAYVMAGVCGLCLLPVFILLGQASCRRKDGEDDEDGNDNDDYDFTLPIEVK